MKLFRSSAEAAGKLDRSAVVIGNFDGVHRGHQELFTRARQLAGPSSAAIALTFSPHPAHFFNPDLAPPLITTEEQKLKLLEACGLDAVVVEPFDATFAARPPEDFCKTILKERLNTAHVLVGHGFLFGEQKAGNVATLTKLGQSLGFEVHGIRGVRVTSIVVSSTKIREFIMLGKVGGASMLLGRDYLVEGTVVVGKKRGRTIGIPTANVAPQNEILPRRGVYAGWLSLADGHVLQSVINIGTNPTFEKADALSLEAHILDYSGDLYGQQVSVHFTQRLRDERRFSSVDELIEAIQGDIAEARVLLKEPALAI